MLVILAALAAGCSARPPIARLTLVTTHDAFPAASIIATDVEDRYCYWRTFLDVFSRFPWNQFMANHALALQRAMHSHPDANLMVNASVWAESISFLLGDRYCVVVRGDLGRIE